MICSICAQRRENAELLGFHLMWDHGIVSNGYLADEGTGGDV